MQRGEIYIYTNNEKDMYLYIYIYGTPFAHEKGRLSRGGYHIYIYIHKFTLAHSKMRTAWTDNSDVDLCYTLDKPVQTPKRDVSLLV